MLEGKITLHGEAGCGKTQLLMQIERILREKPVDAQPTNYRIDCYTQQPGCPEQLEAVFENGKVTWDHTV
jgi:Ni2+-binding GTPase involved in maturation of urease and hydrogenase